MNHILKCGAKASLLMLSAAMVLSCGRTSESTGVEYAPQMYDPIAYEALKQVEGYPNTLNPGGLNMREPAKGTVARGKLGFYATTNMETAEDAASLPNPLEANSMHLEEGKILYTRICSHCHGEAGGGDGLVAEKFKGVPNFAVGRYVNLSQGHIYHVITNGRGRMMPHGSIVNPEERWKIAMYVRQLQTGEVEATPTPEQGEPDPGASTLENTNVVTGEGDQAGQ